MRSKTSCYPWLAVISLLLTFGCATDDQSDDESTVVVLSEFAFDSDQDGTMNIHVATVDGERIRQITHSTTPHFSGYPRWSPDHSRIAFISDRDGDEEIYVMDADGQNISRLTHNPGDDWSPAWGLGGDQIAFVSGQTNHGRIYTVNTDGSGQHLLGDWVGEASGDLDWSPDGKKLLFVSRRMEGREQLFVVEIRSQNVRQLTGHDGRWENSNPSWSPSGEEIVFTSNRNGLWDIYRMDADGSNVRRLTHSRTGSIGNWAAAQSPDGANIVYSSDAVGSSKDWRKNAEIFVVAPDGTNLRRITDNQGMDVHPDW